MKSGHKGHHEHHSEHEHKAHHKGHVAHVHMHMKKRGGEVMEDERTREMEEREERGEKRGGAVKGEKPKHRMDKRARGGRMTPKSPLSGAGHMTHMPYEGHLTHNDMGGKGREPRP